MSNITITDKGKYYEASCGAWSRDGVLWYSEHGAPLIGISIRQVFKQQILDGQAAEPEVFTGDPIENKWGKGVYESPYSVVTVDAFNCASWYGKNVDSLHCGRVVSTTGEVFTRISTNPTDLIAERWKGGSDVPRQK